MRIQYKQKQRHISAFIYFIDFVQLTALNSFCIEMESKEED